MKGGFFITFEGPDGSGKTTLINNLRPFITDELKKDLIITREPGGVKISEAIREILLDKRFSEMGSRTEALLFAAARAQHLDEVIKPALDAGKIVFCDRFVDSSVVYQGIGRKLGVQEIIDINRFATTGINPDMTILLDLPADLGLARIKKHRSEKSDRIDQDQLSFHEQVRRAYLDLAAKNPKRIKIIDGRQSPEKITKNALQLIQEALKGRI